MSAANGYFPDMNAGMMLGGPLYHLYWPTGPRRADLLPHQRMAQDYFLPEKLREELHRRSDATRQMMSVLLSFGSVLVETSF